VSTSHGVTDNGMGTATALELLHYFVQHPPQNTLIFLFNNFEEGGLVGAQTFVQHPWFSTIKLLVNLGMFVFVYFLGFCYEICFMGS
jgi:Zn-dependent M28 family amino/carboxypeptidase